MWHPRTLFRLLRTLLHVLQGALTVAAIYPWINESKRLALKKRWSRQLLAILGVRLRFEGGGGLPHGLLVANHISFLDVFVVNAIAPTTFVSKADVRDWPLIGWLSANTDTLYLERGSRNAAQKAKDNLVHHLRLGKRVAIFPEGTTTRGDTVLPFHSALLQAAVDADVAVTPLVLRYRTRHGDPSSAPAYVDDITLVECLRSIADQGKLYAEVTALTPLEARNHDRRQLSSHAHRMIAHTLGHTVDTNAMPELSLQPIN